MKTYIIASHPDDETLFFSSIMQTKKDVHVICVTDGNADGMGEKRKSDFKSACKAQGATSEMWDFQDIYEKRLDQKRLQEKLTTINDANIVYTHGILGEYGHPHHQDVSFAVHNVFKDKVMSVAYNTYPSELITLNQKSFNLKKEILSTTYLSETIRFSNLIPATFAEGFLKVSFEEVENIFHFLIKKEALDPTRLFHYKWLQGHIEDKFKEGIPRLF